MAETSEAQLRAVAKLQKSSERWTVTAKNDTDRAELLQRAKATKDLPTKFWEFLEREFK